MAETEFDMYGFKPLGLGNPEDFVTIGDAGPRVNFMTTNGTSVEDGLTDYLERGPLLYGGDAGIGIDFSGIGEKNQPLGWFDKYLGKNSFLGKDGGYVGKGDIFGQGGAFGTAMGLGNSFLQGMNLLDKHKMNKKAAKYADTQNKIAKQQYTENSRVAQDKKDFDAGWNVGATRVV